MSEACMHDPYEQCFRECESCPRYQPPNHYCEFCGAEENLYNINDGSRPSNYDYYVCEDCLEKTVIDEHRMKNEDAIEEFLIEYSDEFHKFLKDWFSEVRVVDDR